MVIRRLAATIAAAALAATPSIIPGHNPFLAHAVATTVTGTDPQGAYWQFQGATPDCLEQSVRIALDATGHHAPSESVIDTWAFDRAMYNPWLGTFSPKWPKIITHFGGKIVSGPRPTSLRTVTKDLAVGDAVILIVNAARLWEPQGYTPSDKRTTVGNHAINIDTIEGNYAIITDTGIPTGAIDVLPLNLVKQAWAASGYQAVAIR